MRGMSIRRLEPGEYAALGPRIAAIEGDVEYPLGADRFRIDHGDDYFAFFRRMGELTYFAGFDPGAREGRLLGVLAAVRCRHPDAWYLCDLKVRPEERGRPIAAGLLRAFIATCVTREERAYAISMNPDAGDNRVVRLLRRLGGDRTRADVLLQLFSLDAHAMRRFEPALRALRGDLSYLSLLGRKEIILRSTGRPMPLLHVQFGPRAEQGDPSPRDGHVHMFCTPSGDPLDQAVRAAGHAPTASATVLHAGLEDVDWSFVLTSDI